MVYIGDFWDGSIGSSILEALRSLMLSLCEIIYKLIVFFFNIFMKLASASILTDDTIMVIYERVGLLIGLFMIFRVLFSLIQYIINPDNMFDKNKGIFNIVKRVVIVIILLGVTPSLFRYAFRVQEKIVESNIIPKVITGQNISTENAGKELAWYTFTSFYNFSSDNFDVVSKCPYLKNGTMKNDFYDGVNLRYAYNCVNIPYEYVDAENKTNKAFIINFDGNGVVSVVVGLIILCMIVMYVIQVGIRVIQLAYLQLIAPAPIIMYLTPKGNDTLNKWVKQCTTTYLDFFIRVAIIYFVVFVIQFFMNADYNDFTDFVGDATTSEQTWITIIIIIALLIFAQKVPKLLKEVFPSLGGGAASFDFGLNPKKVFNNTLAASAIGAVGGAIGAGASNAVHGYMNMKKAFKNNGGLTSGKAWGAALGAGLKGTASVAGGIMGGAKAGLKTKDITKVGEAVKTANKNRTERELKAEAGYHWYNPLPAMGDKILEFSGEPGSADIVKNKQQAIRDEKQKEQRFSKGANIAANYAYKTGEKKGKLNTDAAFSNQKFRDSYNAVAEAKSNLGKAELQLEQAQSNLHAAYNLSPNDPERESKIIAATSIYEKAKKNHKSMSGQLDLAKSKHDTNRKIYASDAEVEDDFKYWKDISDMQEQYKEIPELKIDDSKKSNGSNVENIKPEHFDDGQISMEDYMNMDQQVSDASMEVANTIAKKPGTPAVKEAIEKYIAADQARDEAMEKIASQSESDDSDNNLPKMSVNVSEMNKLQLKKSQSDLEKRYRELNKQYTILENKSMNGESIDASEFGKIKEEQQEINRVLEKIYTELNK